MSADYVSDIPESAEERVVERYDTGAKREARYLAGGEVVGVRLFHPDGRIELESPRRAGEPNGTEYQWDDKGQLRSALPYVDGLEHGISRQWAPDGRPLGTYELRHGTGLDLWRGQRQDGSPYLAEARSVVSGQRHGLEWLIDQDQRSVHRETRFAGGLEHGIRREWDADRQLREGHPRFYLLDREVDGDEYEYGRSIDPDLPPYDAADDQAARTFPDAVAEHLTP
jgi:antitoxin component YwqK of YwqJK toxin-antitoxin module